MPTYRYGLRVRTHAHSYRPHGDGYHACTLCGFVIPEHLLAYAIEHGATIATPQQIASEDRARSAYASQLGE